MDNNIYNKHVSLKSYTMSKIINNIKQKLMAFRDMFKDENDINEKNVVGFASFAVMALFAIVDLITGIYGKEIAISEYIYNSFVVITLGCFGISEVGKMFGKKESKPDKK